MSHPSSTPVPMRTVLSHIAVPIAMGFVMALAYLGGFHKPSPHDIPVAIVGTSAQAGPVAAQIQQKTGDMLDLRTVPTRAEAERQLRTQDIAGAFVPSKGKPTLLSAPAASDSTTTAVRKVFTAVAAAQDKPLTEAEVVPVDKSDPIGQNGFFYLVTLSVGSYAAAIAIGAAGATRRVLERCGLVLGAAVVTATVQLFFARVFFGMFSGHVPAVWGLSLLYSITVMAIGVGLHTVVGRFSTLLFSAMFVAFNFTSSGGVLQPALQPGLFGWLNSFWIGSGFLRTMGHILYFPDAGIAHGMWILLGWLAFGLACLGMAFGLERRRLRTAGVGAVPAAPAATANGASEAPAAVDTTGTWSSSPVIMAGAATQPHRRRDGLTDAEATELELEEDVAT